jgi:hypothetical protein
LLFEVKRHKLQRYGLMERIISGLCEQRCLGGVAEVSSLQGRGAVSLGLSVNSS